MASITPIQWTITATNTAPIYGALTGAYPFLTPTRNRVHANTPVGAVVRDDIAGKYYLEVNGKRACRLTFREAVNYATMPGSTVNYDLPGGSTFDRKVREALGR